MAEITLASELAANFLRGRLNGIADRLEAMAKEVRHRAARIDHEKPTTVADAVIDTQHAVLWGVSNLSLDDLPRRLFDYSSAREREALESQR